MKKTVFLIPLLFSCSAIPVTSGELQELTNIVASVEENVAVLEDEAASGAITGVGNRQTEAIAGLVVAALSGVALTNRIRDRRRAARDEPTG